jgi:WD40 repeat protein
MDEPEQNKINPFYGVDKDLMDERNRLTMELEKEKREKEEQAERERQKKEEEAKAALRKAKLEEQKKLNDAKSFLQQDILAAMKTIPPLDLNREGSIEFTSEAFAWFVDDEQGEITYQNNTAFIATGSADKTIRLWDPSTGTCTRLLSGHSGAVRGLAVHPTKPLLVSVSSDRTVCLWNTDDGEQIQRYGNGKPMKAVAFSPKNNSFVTGDQDGRITHHRKIAGKYTNIRHFQNTILENIATLTFSPDGQTVLAAYATGSVKEWNLLSGTVVQDYNRSSMTKAFCAVYSPCGTKIAVAYNDSKIFVWKRGTNSCKILDGHQRACRDVVFSQDGGVLFSAGQDSTILRWDLASGSIEDKRLAHRKYVLGLELLSDDVLISASSDWSVKLWNTTGFIQGKTLAGHEGAVNSVVSKAVGSTFINVDLEKIYTDAKANLRDLEYTLSTDDGFNYRLMWTARA